MKTLVAVLIGVFVFSSLGVAFATTVAAPEVDQVGTLPSGSTFTSIVLGATAPPVMTTCTGEDGQVMEQIVGKWVGDSTDGDAAGTHDWRTKSKPSGVSISAKF